MPLDHIQRLRLELQLVRIQRGDATAIPELIAAWEPPLLLYLRRICPSEEDAWDALQESWMKALRGLPQLRDPLAFPAWIYRIARNQAFAMQRGQVLHELLPDEADRAEYGAELPDFSADDAQEIHWALNALDLHHREPLILLFLDDLSIGEIANLLGTPEGTVKSRIHHAKRKLRHIIEKERQK